MYPISNLTNTATIGGVSRVSPLSPTREEEALEFLAERPAQTFAMAGWIRENGVLSPHNRGTFFASRNETGQLDGIALIGHNTLFEARSESALAAFAELTMNCPNVFRVLGEWDKVDRFVKYFKQQGRIVRLECREHLFEKRWPLEILDPVPGLRLARLPELDLVVPVHAQMAFEECGVNPLDKDPVGFRQRCERRIRKGKTFVWIEDSKLIFKADVISETPEVTYVEGIWVNPDERGKNYGQRCLSQLVRQFLDRTPSVILMVNQDFKRALNFYQRAGFRLLNYMDTVYIEPEVSLES
jgi:ribosomal protein S18 acetylase RimI-like enzyme